MAERTLTTVYVLPFFVALAATGCNRPAMPTAVATSAPADRATAPPSEQTDVAAPQKPEDGLPRPSSADPDGLGIPARRDSGDTQRASSTASGDALGAEENAPTSQNDLSTERLVLFLPGGPLVVELRMTIDGGPFRAARQVLVDEALKLADGDHDGRATWNEVYSDPKRVFVQRFDLTTNGMARKEFMRINDTNQNGLVDRDEARRLVARAKYAGAAFSVEGSSEYRRSNPRRSIVRTMLDANDDDLLDEAELAAAEARLLARDANDDQIVTWSELDDSLAGDAQAMTTRTNAYLNHPAALALGDRTDWDGIIYTLSEQYLALGGTLDESFSLAPSMARALDDDGDGQLAYDEIRRLNVIEPQLVVAANFGKPGDQVAGVSLVRLSPEVGVADEIVLHTPRGIVLTLDGYRLQIVLDDRAPADAGGPTPEEQLAMFDKNKDGYLEKDEVKDVSPDAARMFDQWDSNGDGKIYLDELAAYRRSQQAPQSSAIRAVAGDDSDVLFPLLDANQDGRLTTRELRAARESLLALDSDGDGRLSLEELPGGLTLLLSRGLPSNMSPQRRGLAAMPAPAAGSGPDWFVRMDANRDQEVSLDEFPGSAEKFRSLDLDGDGFVSASEAQAKNARLP